jgi:VWFA-related protein
MVSPRGARCLVARLSLTALVAMGVGDRVAASVAVSPTAPVAEAPAAAGSPRFGDEISVRLSTVVVRVVDGAGDPLLGLTPGDFRVQVGKQEVPVAAVDWFVTAAATPAATPSDTHEVIAEAMGGRTGTDQVAVMASPTSAPAQPAAVAAPAGKLVVIFVQADSNAPSRTRGHLRTLPFTRELLDALQPEDQVAVISFDSHLKLWQDFTRRHTAIPETIYQAIHYGGDPPAPMAAGTAGTAGDAGALSLGAHFDAEAARRAASPERALALTAEALSALPGEKVVVFLAWGLGSFSSWGTRMTPAFAPAVRALTAARASVFVLDVTDADSHDLEAGLRGIADATGGTYDKTNLFPALAVRQLARTISGYYVLTLDAASLPAAGGEVQVALRGRRGTVLLRPTLLHGAPPR